MSEVFLPSYAKIPNGPHEPNPTPRGIMVVDQPYKMAKTLMKLANKMAKPRSGPPKSRFRSRSRMPSKSRKKEGQKWY